jgi:endonuclease/exonuclease/phosphatase (EEP) superfamily protein YafD
VNRRWCFATRALVGATVGWLVFVGLQRLLSARFWLWLLADLLPPVAFAVVPVLLLSGLAIARLAGRAVPANATGAVAAGAILALALGAGYTGLSVAGLSGRPLRVPDNALRVFAWNTEYWAQASRPDDFYRYLRAQRADIYLLQEYLHWDSRAGLLGARQIDERARLRLEFPGFQVAARGELLTLSRFPVVAQPPVGPDRTVTATDFQTVFAAVKVLRTDLRIGGTVLSVYNVHIPVQVDLEPTTRFLDYVRERDGARRTQFRGLESDVAANPHPVLVAGDFNTSPAMDDLRPLRTTLHDAAAADGSVYPASWPAGAVLPLWRLDWAFTSSGVAVYRYGLVGSAGLSDHRAQSLSITVEDER